MERIDVYRGEESVDQDGNRIQGRLVFWKSFMALVAPASHELMSGTESLPVEFDHTAYIRSSEPTGICESDILCIRGRKSAIVGVVANWKDKSGHHIGDVVSVKQKEG
jgi:hypothetical protein